MGVMADFGQRLKEYRSKNGLSQEAVAKRLGVSAQAVSKWEKGKSLPDLSVLLPLSELFGVSADELLGGEPPAGRWEAEWHRAIRAGDPGRAAITALQALEQFPGDNRFLCRLAEAEFLAGIRAEKEEDRQRFLRASEEHHRAILRQFPDHEEASYRLAMTLNALGKPKEAEFLARSLKHFDEALLQILRGEAREKELKRLTAKRALELYEILMRRPEHAKMDLAEKLLEVLPWDPRDRLNLLSAISCSRASLFCREGDADAAMAALYRIKELARQWEDLPEDGEGAESTLFGRVFGSSGGPDILFAFSLLHDPGLKPLFDREEYRELMRLRDETWARMGMTVIEAIE